MKEVILEYIEPSLLVLSLALFLLGKILYEPLKKKNMQESIPLILTGVSVPITALWVLGTRGMRNEQNLMIAIFTIIVQGVIVAGLAVIAHEISPSKDEKIE